MGVVSQENADALDNYEFILIIHEMVKIARPVRPLLWVASSKRDYGEFPERV